MKVEGAGSVKGPRVEASRTQKPFDLESAGDVAKVARALKGVHKEKVKLSGWTELADELLDAARSAPDVRHDLVARIKSEIEGGTYHRPTEAIAERIVQEEIEFLKHSK
ncbi:MAG TPA: flagellar biosynthesis anti-sigma factor FlgM [Proteobacteria bacterium]|nr:flagellar biosynthesis anti-sigma factor FlgM [Pseudomonadota bacterium]